MSIRKICHYPDPVLRKETEEVTLFDEDFIALTQDMAETMYDAPGIGLAAPQIGVSKKLVIVDTSEDDEEQSYMVMANPEIVSKEGGQIDEEGCLSLPGLTSKVKRFKKIKVKYQNEKGEEQELETEDRFAVVLQHEIDHINGVLFLDHLSSLKKNLYKKKRKKMMASSK